jgi:chitin disaccharide deacetylase
MNALIVTCDDCGLSEGVNSATLDLHRRGIAGGASVMTNFPAAAHALDLFRACPGLSVGVHLNLTEGFPLTSIPALTELTGLDGRFRPLAHLARQALFPSARILSSIEEELTAQFELLARAGFAPRHVSTHLQFHALPSLRRIVLRLAHAYRVPWVRPHRVRATVVPWNPLLSRKLGASGPETRGATAPDYMAVLRNWQGRAPEALSGTLDGLSGTVELVVHPDIADDPTFPSYIAYGSRGRFAETKFLERCWPLLRQRL